MPALETIYSPMTEPYPRHADVDFQHGDEGGQGGGDDEFGEELPLVGAHGAQQHVCFSSVAMKPLSMLSMATMSPMSMVMNTMGSLPVPHQMMMRGPSAILGRALSTTR